MAREHSNAYSWQDPRGEFHPVGSEEYSHGSMAHKLTGQVKDPIMTMWQKGWNRISHYSDTLFLHNEVSPPNSRQKKEIIDLAIEAGFRQVNWDYGDDYKVLWSVHDSLE